MFETYGSNLYFCIHLRVLVFNTIPYQMMFALFDSNLTAVTNRTGNTNSSGAHEFVSVFCLALYICSSLWVIVVLYLLVIVLSVLLRFKGLLFTTFEIFKLFVLTYFLRNNAKRCLPNWKTKYSSGINVASVFDRLIILFCLCVCTVMFSIWIILFPEDLAIYNVLCVVPNG